MNKKFSTLMAGLLLSGGLFNSVLAEKLPYGEVAKSIESGKYYFFVNKTNDSYAYGFKENATNDKFIDQQYAQIDGDVTDYKEFVWKVEVAPIEVSSGVTTAYGYKLTNLATGKQLFFDANGTVDTDYSDANPTNVLNQVVWFGNAAIEYRAKEDKDGSAYAGPLYKNDATSGKSALVITQTGLSRAGTTTVYPWFFYSVNSSNIDATELNDLYNSTGFNFVLNQDKWKDVDNIFAKEGDRIMAVQVVDGNVKSSDGKYSFPVGTYFVVNNKLGAVPPATKGGEIYDFLMNSTLIAASPSVNDINDADWRKAGQGFQLIKKAGRDLVKVGTNKDLQGEDVSVNNACFKVTKDLNGDYALQLATFYYNEKTGAEKQISAAVAIKVTAKDGDDHGDLYLTTDAKAENFIFDFKEVNTVSYTKFLNQNAKAVYNIQFVNDDLAGKYLFTPAYAPDTAYAKGAKFVDPTAPEAQYIITDVDLDDNNITFENRANKAYSFTAKFYQEADGVYSMAIKNGASQKTFTDLNVDKDGNIVVASTEDLHTQWVKLTPVTVDMFAGAWDVDNLTEVTMSFARDDKSTSNRLFVMVKDNQKGITVSDNQSDAIQFQLVKNKEVNYITNEYAYLSADNKVKKYADGDTIAYYTYKFQAYRDGEAVEKYLAWNSTGSKYGLVDDVNTANNFIIKDNAADGSVTILYGTSTVGDYDYTKNIVVDEWNVASNSIENFDGHNIIEASLAEISNAKDVKTFLKVESPEVSLDPKTTYATLTTELDNYVAIKNDRDAIITGKETTLRLFATDTDRQIPSFLISTGWNGETGERQFLFNSVDSVDYNVATGEFNKEYALNGDYDLNKAIFRVGKLNADHDTIVTTIKGKETAVATVADQNKNVQAGLNRYKFQIVEDLDNEGYYLVRQGGYYLFNINEYLVFANSDQYNRTNALRVKVTNVEAPTANETIAAGNVVVAGTNGAVVVKGAEGKNVIVSTILGKVVANEVLTSDNAQITAPAGVVVVSVDGESFKVVVK
ncbi:DUF6383 domain-containing protein [Parabacteroides sp. AD58]|uniref:DUF6383 domain-containing protein n=1 Tax=Parabacteroides absconsus TaxID=2951805 RepID=A0ABZ2IP50_9BACT|nr:DUF6383 domain-containing protein [Parabacteroides sp. AD58]MCM6901492.1 DUF6383 domain-containing protein [Parabacteroides sp. AD58]